MKTIALVIGHKQSSPGAINTHFNISEWTYNNKLVNDIINLNNQEGNKVNLIKVYREKYSHLPKKINNLNPDYVISFHCNAFNTKATGSETLYYHSSQNGKLLAQKFQTAVVNSLTLSDRGIKSKTTEDRGGYLLRYTNDPCIILEPFFIDNDKDYLIARTNHNILVSNLLSTMISL